MEKVKIAIVGLGAIAQVVHLPVLKKLPDVEITAICDIDTNKSKFVASKFGIKKSYRDFDLMLRENPEIDAVIIATSTDSHTELAIKSFDAGKDVLIEKPIGRNYTETKQIVDSATKNKKNLMVAMNNRFRGDAMLQRSFIRSGEIGNLFYIKTGWLKTQSSTTKWFMQMDKSGGGVFMDNGIVMLDLGMWMLGFPDVYSVTSVNYYHNTKTVEDSNFTLVKLQNGSTLTIEVSWSLLRGGEFYYCNAFGVEGSSSINPLRIHKKINNELIEVTPKTSKTEHGFYKKSYEYQMKHFVGAIKGLYKIVSTGDEALKVMQVVDAVYTSAKTNKEIIIKQ